MNSPKKPTISIRKFLNGQKSLLKNYILIVLGSAILAFGIYNVHSYVDITEGGILGLSLLLEHLLYISPAVSGFVISLACYLIGFAAVGKQFVAYSVVASFSYSLFYGILEFFPRIWPELYKYPILSAILGAIFVGVGVGICMRMGGAPSGDDAIALTMKHVFKTPVAVTYFVMDAVILIASLCYIPLDQIIFSLVSVILSGQIVGLLQIRKK
ncbi:MAG: YitT family protein [Lachnospiraceae bacterium]|nr:YitT family protein [Lachnospiraceae bacterium]